MREAGRSRGRRGRARAQAFIKWGQWAATRPDLFPGDLCAELARLHTGAPRHGFGHTRAAVEGAFRRPLAELFDEFDAAPVASGSIAQVHRAVLSARGASGSCYAPGARPARASKAPDRDCGQGRPCFGGCQVGGTARGVVL
jgi:aarF domain-containing kinase